MYLTTNDLARKWVFDIETDGLNPTVIWCLVAHNLGTKEWREFYGPSINQNILDFFSSIGNCWSVGHNVMSYDIPVLRSLAKLEWSNSRCIDTLILSSLYNPRLAGGHSLEAYGERFGLAKVEHTDWSKFSPAMLARCRRDVEITAKLYLALVAKMKAVGFSERSCQLEHEIRPVLDKQQRNGFYFDIDGAIALTRNIRGRQAAIGEDIRKLIPDELQVVAEHRYRTRKDGSDFASYTRHLEKYPKVTRDGALYQVWDWHSFNIGSPQQRLQKLIELGYTPTKKTKSGGLAVDEDVLIEAAEKLQTPQIKAMADWLVCEGRANMIEKWMSCYNPDTHCLHGDVYTCGAGSRRMTHSNPNTANIPKAKPKVQYGRESRSLWRPRPGRVLVGYDAKSLEMRTFCHYVNNPEVTELYIHGDPHARNADALSVDRDTTAKTLFYGFIYGASDSKLGSIVGKNRESGAFIRETLLKITPGLEQFTRETQAEYTSRGGWLSCIDGGHVRCPSPHASVNYKCQPMGALIMKQASIYLDEQLTKRGLDGIKVGDIHDEGQLDCLPSDAEEVGKEAIKALINAGEELGSRVPMDGDYKIGASWADTH